MQQKRFPAHVLAAAGLAVVLGACGEDSARPAQANPDAPVVAESPDSSVAVPGAAQPGPQFENE